MIQIENRLVIDAPDDIHDKIPDLIERIIRFVYRIVPKLDAARMSSPVRVSIKEKKNGLSK